MNDNGKKLNRLGGETSPYLLQHAGNPVDWHPWDDEAFAKARAEDKPVFLSIGYSTCHWCHVMERESFENAEVAALMNRAFVSIKVDREERPDVDGIYMEFCQALTGSGGWPLTIVMTPDRKPFFAATYIPRESGRRGMGMLELVPRLGELWRNDRERLVESAERITAAVRNHSGEFEHSGAPDPGEGFKALTGRFDAKHGGFGGAPKFPTAHLLIFLTRYWRAAGDGRAKDMAVQTLEAMRRGGIYDHLGFGFHRYSTDAQWRLPHFEKMLYDQALLSLAYLEGSRAFGVHAFGETAREIFTYVIRDLASPSGAFYSAEDADSEGEEGRFYVWRHQEILQILGKEEGDAFCRAYGVKPAGNFRDESSGSMAGDNVLLLGDDTAPEEHVASRRILLDARGKRPRPHRDEKILTDWNGLMIAALARGARVLNDPSLAEAARRAADFILAGMRTPDGNLLHCLRGELPPVPAMADDYAFFTWGLLELYETTFQALYLREALTLTDRFITSFLDDATGAFFSTGREESDDLLFRRRELYDSAMPSANSVTMMNILRLARMTGRDDYEETARRIGEAYPRELSRHPAACSHLLSGILMAEEEPVRIVLSGPAGLMGSEPVKETQESGTKGSEPVKKLIAAANRVYLPHAVILLAGEPGSGEDLEGLLPGSESHIAAPGQARAQVCVGVACRNPVTKPEEFEELLAGL